MLLGSCELHDAPLGRGPRAPCCWGSIAADLPQSGQGRVAPNDRWRAGNAELNNFFHPGQFTLLLRSKVSCNDYELLRKTKCAFEKADSKQRVGGKVSWCLADAEIQEQRNLRGWADRRLHGVPDTAPAEGTRAWGSGLLAFRPGACWGPCVNKHLTCVVEVVQKYFACLELAQLYVHHEELHSLT